MGNLKKIIYKIIIILNKFFMFSLENKYRFYTVFFIYNAITASIIIPIIYNLLELNNYFQTQNNWLTNLNWVCFYGLIVFMALYEHKNDLFENIKIKIIKSILKESIIFVLISMLVCIFIYIYIGTYIIELLVIFLYLLFTIIFVSLARVYAGLEYLECRRAWILEALNHLSLNREFIVGYKEEFDSYFIIGNIYSLEYILYKDKQLIKKYYI